MKISGHKTRAVFDRYNIIDGKDIKDAGKKLAEFFEGAGMILGTDAGHSFEVMSAIIVVREAF